MDLSNSYGTVSPPAWPDVWVVGNGPSARTFDLLRAEGWVLAVNDSVFPLVALLGLKVAVFSLDSSWIYRHRLFLSSFSGEKYLALPLETFPECAGIQGAVYLQWAYESGLSTDARFLNTGGNSGYAAINLAFLKGARRIHLIGFDMEGDDDRFRQWIPRFSTMLPQLKEAGVEVYNHYSNSAIRAFPFAD